MPDICPYDTTSPSDTRRAFDLLKFHRIFRCRRFLNPKHITSDADNATLINTGEPPTTLGTFATATRYCWFYVLKSTTSNKIINFLSQFRAYVVHLPRQFHADFDRKLKGGKCFRWINNNKSKIIAAPTKRQSANGLIKRT